MALRKDVKHPFPPESDEVTVADAKPDGQAATSRPASRGGSRARSRRTTRSRGRDLVIDFDGLAGRVTRVPLEADNYGGLTREEGPPALHRRLGASTTAARATGRRSLRLYSLKDRKETTLVPTTSRLRALGRRHRRCWCAGPAARSALLRRDADRAPASKKTVSTAGLMVDRVPAEEWTQIFNEVWRRYRDLFYVENMHGYDWEALRQAVRAAGSRTSRTAPT